MTVYITLEIVFWALVLIAIGFILFIPIVSFILGIFIFTIAYLEYRLPTKTLNKKLF